MDKQPVKPKWVSFLDRYFFAKTRFYSLGLIRIALVLLGVHYIFRQYGIAMHSITYINAELDNLHEPSLLINLLPLPFPLEPEYAQTFAYFYYFIAFCAAVGLFTRPALFIFGLATIYIIDVEVSRGFFNHEASLTTQVLLVLALAPGSTSFSVDNLLKWAYRRYKIGTGNLLSAIIGPPASVWGIKLILILLASVYFTAGVSKIRYGGLAWLDGQTLTHYLDGSASPYTEGNKPMYIGPKNVPQKEKWKDGFGIYTYSYGNRQRSNFWQKVGHAIAANKFLITAFAVSATVFELSAFLLLLNGWPRVFYLLGAILMHKSIGLLMNLPFSDYQVLCFLLIDWRWVYEHLPINNGLRQRINAAFSHVKLLHKQPNTSI